MEAFKLKKTFGKARHLQRFVHSHGNLYLIGYGRPQVHNLYRVIFFLIS